MELLELVHSGQLVLVAIALKLHLRPPESSTRSASLLRNSSCSPRAPSCPRYTTLQAASPQHLGGHNPDSLAPYQAIDLGIGLEVFQAGGHRGVPPLWFNRLWRVGWHECEGTLRPVCT